MNISRRRAKTAGLAGFFALLLVAPASNAFGLKVGSSSIYGRHHAPFVQLVSYGSLAGLLSSGYRGHRHGRGCGHSYYGGNAYGSGYTHRSYNSAGNHGRSGHYNPGYGHQNGSQHRRSIPSHNQRWLKRKLHNKHGAGRSRSGHLSRGYYSSRRGEHRGGHH